MHDAGRLVSLQGAAVRGQDVVGQVGEIEVSLLRQGLQHQKAFEHLHTQLINDI